MKSKEPKFYAVRVGKSIGIFRSWAECEAQVHGVAGAQFKSFPSEAEANAYLAAAPCRTAEAGSGRKKRSTALPEEDSPYPVPPETLVAFVDGSYHAAKKRYGYGCVLLFPDGTVTCEKGAGEDPRAVSARNVAGELMATRQAMTRAVELGFRNLRICHDYSGIASWYQGEWRANSYVASEYVAFSETVRGSLSVSFEKIAAHTGVKYNEMADRLAKQAAGILEEGSDE